MNKKARVLIIYPSAFFSPQWGKVLSIKPHLIDLITFLNKNFEVNVLDLEIEIGRPNSRGTGIEDFIRKARRLISGYSFDAVGISCWSSLNYLSTVAVAEVCKELNPKIPIIVGGHHPSALPDDFIYKNSPFDFIVQGEGEIAFEKICQNPGRKMKQPVIIQSPPFNLQKARLNLITENDYRYVLSEKNSIFFLYLSRGCPFSCSYCIEKIKGCSKWRSFSVGKAIKKIKDVINIYNPKRIVINDACFGYDKRWRREFLKSLIKMKIDKLFWAETRIDLIEREDIDLLSKLNFGLDYGMETGSEKMLSIMNKTVHPRRYLSRCKEVIAYSAKKRLYNRLFLIFNHPGEDRNTYKETLKFLDGILKENKNLSTVPTVGSYHFTAGSRIFHNLKYYQEKYGTRILYPQWWKEKREQYTLATSVVASRDFEGRADYRNYWKKEFFSLQSKYLENMHGESKLLYSMLWGDEKMYRSPFYFFNKPNKK